MFVFDLTLNLPFTCNAMNFIRKHAGTFTFTKLSHKHQNYTCICTNVSVYKIVRYSLKAFLVIFTPHCICIGMTKRTSNITVYN